MKIECIKEQLEWALSKADKIAGKNTSLPVLSGFYLEADRNQLLIKSTNLDLGISITIPVKVLEIGKVVVPAHTLSSLVASVTKERSLTLESKDQLLEVKTPSLKTQLKTLSLEEFPLIPELSDDGAFSLPVKDFVSGLRSVIYASAIGSIKPELSSVAVIHEDGYLTFAATDSFRLAEKKVKIKQIPHFKQILIPQKNVLEIIKIFDKGDEELSISIGEHQLALHSQNVYLTSRTIEGVFPDYRQILPKEKISSATVLKQDLLNSLKTTLIFSDSFNQLTLRISPKKKSFEIESRNVNVGEIVHNVEAVLEGEDLSINVNHRYFTDCFQSLPTDSLMLSFSGQAKPIVIQGVGDKTFTYLVMPMNQS